MTNVDKNEPVSVFITISNRTMEFSSQEELENYLIYNGTRFYDNFFRTCPAECPLNYKDVKKYWKIFIPIYVGLFVLFIVGMILSLIFRNVYADYFFPSDDQIALYKAVKSTGIALMWIGGVFLLLTLVVQAAIIGTQNQRNEDNLNKHNQSIKDIKAWEAEHSRLLMERKATVKAVYKDVIKEFKKKIGEINGKDNKVDNDVELLIGDCKKDKIKIYFSNEKLVYVNGSCGVPNLDKAYSLKQEGKYEESVSLYIKEIYKKKIMLTEVGRALAKVLYALNKYSLGYRLLKICADIEPNRTKDDVYLPPHLSFLRASMPDYMYMTPCRYDLKELKACIKLAAAGKTKSLMELTDKFSGMSGKYKSIKTKTEIVDECKGIVANYFDK